MTVPYGGGSGFPLELVLSPAEGREWRLGGIVLVLEILSHYASDYVSSYFETVVGTL